MKCKSQSQTSYSYFSFLNLIFLLLFMLSSSASSSSSKFYIETYQKIISNSHLSSSSVSINKNSNFNNESDYEENNDFDQFYLSNLNDYYSYNNTNPLFEISSDYGISSKEYFPLKDEVEYLLIKEYNILHILKEKRIIEVIKLSIILKNYLLYEDYIFETKSSFKEEYGKFYKSQLSNMSKRRFINAIKQKINYIFNNTTYKLIYSALRFKQNQLKIIYTITKNLCSEIENLINEDKVYLLKFYFSCLSTEKQSETIINSNEFFIFIIFFIDENSVVISEGSEDKDELMLFPLVDLLKTSVLTIENDSQKMFLQIKNEDYKNKMINLIIKKVNPHGEGNHQFDYNFQFFYSRNIMKGSKLGKSTYKTLFSNMSLLENKIILLDPNWNFFINEKELLQKINSELNAHTVNNQMDLLVFPHFLNKTNFYEYINFLYRKSYDSIEEGKLWYMLNFYMKELTCLSICSTCICEYTLGFNNNSNNKMFDLYNGLSSDEYYKEYDNHKSRLLILKIMNFLKNEEYDIYSLSINYLKKHSLIEYFSILNFQLEVFLKKREYYIKIINYIISLMVRRLYMYDINYIKKMIIK